VPGQERRTLYSITEEGRSTHHRIVGHAPQASTPAGTPQIDERGRPARRAAPSVTPAASFQGLRSAPAQAAAPPPTPRPRRLCWTRLHESDDEKRRHAAEAAQSHPASPRAPARLADSAPRGRASPRQLSKKSARSSSAPPATGPAAGCGPER
jgi:hypothetical protein